MCKVCGCNLTDKQDKSYGKGPKKAAKKATKKKK